jgi:hypothetical protein
MQCLPLETKKVCAAHSCVRPAPIQPLHSYVVQHDTAHLLLRWGFEAGRATQHTHKPSCRAQAAVLSTSHSVWQRPRAGYQYQRVLETTGLSCHACACPFQSPICTHAWPCIGTALGALGWLCCVLAVRPTGTHANPCNTSPVDMAVTPKRPSTLMRYLSSYYPQHHYPGAPHNRRKPQSHCVCTAQARARCCRVQESTPTLCGHRCTHG